MQLPSLLNGRTFLYFDQCRRLLSLCQDLNGLDIFKIEEYECIQDELGLMGVENVGHQE